MDLNIDKIVDIIFIVLDIFVITYMLYYVITGIFAFKKSKKKKKSFKPRYKFAVVIPARNEENVILDLISSLKLQNYDKKLYDIFVVANNCTDNTVKISEENGAKVIECEEGIQNKGDALKFAFSKIMKMEEKYTGFVVFDSDNVVHPDFLKHINNAMCQGYDVVQGYRDSKNPKDNWISSSYTLFYMIQNYFFNRARTRMNFSSSINGTGFAMTTKVLKKYGFNTKTITEDIEYAALCSLNDVKIYFEEYAITYDEQPTLFDASWKQRKRWSLGTIACMKHYSGKLLKKCFKNNKLQSFDMALFYMAPIIQIITFVSMIASVIYNITDIKALMSKLLIICISYVFCVFFSIMTILLRKKKLKDYVSGIFMLAFFMLTWIPINIVCLFTKNFKWDKINHDRKVKIESIVKFD